MMIFDAYLPLMIWYQMIWERFHWWANQTQSFRTM